MSLAGKRIFGSFRSLFRKEQAPSFLSPSPEEEMKTALQRFKREKLYCLPDNTLSDVAKRLGVDSHLLYKYFAERGTDFRSWRTALRIHEAKRLMKAHSDEPVANIGRRVGINDRSNFCRQFKELVGETPQNWKKNKK